MGCATRRKDGVLICCCAALNRAAAAATAAAGAAAADATAQSPLPPRLLIPGRTDGRTKAEK
jgi:hypothetical protein